ncbi:MAG: hypothetical protein ACK5RG_09545 [Cyclobacteriaceae bacterium]|jgi:hypothetical protein|nr:hypothetical protein [Flammeovirgaceae bacterium]
MTQNQKQIILTAVMLISFLAVRAQTASTIVGQWKDEKEPERQMEFYLDKDGLYYAKVVNSKKKDIANGQVLVKKLQYDESTQTFKGMMSPPDANLELKATVSFLATDKLKIVAKKAFLTKTLILVRIK